MGLWNSIAKAAQDAQNSKLAWGMPKNIESINAEIDSNRMYMGFTDSNIMYLYEIRDDSVFANALLDIFKFLYGSEFGFYNIGRNHRYNFNDNASAENLFMLSGSDKNKIIVDDIVYYKLSQIDKGIHPVIKALFNIKENYSDNKTISKVIKSYINEFLVSQNLDIIDDIVIDFDIMLSSSVLLDIINEEVEIKRLESSFKSKLPDALKQAAKRILESKAAELKATKDSINTKIESIKLNADFEAFLNHKGAAMLKELELENLDSNPNENIDEKRQYNNRQNIESAL